MIAEIGTAKDNIKAPVHNWYRFTAGFSHKFVHQVIRDENIGCDDLIYEPFAGCGTTLVEARLRGIPAVGNEAQRFMTRISRGKMAWRPNKNMINKTLSLISCMNNTGDTHPLLQTLFSEENLSYLYRVKESIKENSRGKTRDFMNLALSQTLHQTSSVQISPYIARKHIRKTVESSETVFPAILSKMMNDLNNEKLYGFPDTSKVYCHDSRGMNQKIGEGSCTICITSPPYLNNLDYGEISRVHTHFFGLTEDFRDIANRVRRNLVTGATTHFSPSLFSREKWLSGDFARNNVRLAHQIMEITEPISRIKKERGGGKNYDILAHLYFADMYRVLSETARVLKPGGKCFFILGDSAPYGVFIPTTKILGEIALSVGFKHYSYERLRQRGTKWKKLKFRHDMKLDENVLVIGK